MKLPSPRASSRQKSSNSRQKSKISFKNFTAAGNSRRNYSISAENWPSRMANSLTNTAITVLLSYFLGCVCILGTKYALLAEVGSSKTDESQGTPGSDSWMDFEISLRLIIVASRASRAYSWYGDRATEGLALRMTSRGTSS